MLKTILVVYSDKPVTLKEVNDRKMQKYAFNTKEIVEVGDVLKSKSYSTNMQIVDIANKAWVYYNASTGELTEIVNSTKCYPIKELVLREENENVVYATKVNNK